MSKRLRAPKNIASQTPAGPGLAETFAGYDEFLTDLKARIRHARVRAALAVNRELVLFYWQLGRDILQRQRDQGWGAKVIERLSVDLRREFPEMRGFSPRNLKYIRTFAAAWDKPEFVQELLAQIPWSHHVVLLDKLKSPADREWYVRKTIEHGWSSNVLIHWIETGLHRRDGQAQTNFTRTLPAPQSDLVQQLIKSPYRFDFAGVGREAQEREIESALVHHIRHFLLELGIGFAFVGSQYALQVGEEEFFVDLLFYHTRLRRYFVLELKADKFRPEYAGKLNFYCSVIDDLLRHGDDQQTIGLLLCRGQDRLVAEYALRGIHTPIGVSAYQLLPEDLRRSLPTIEQLEAELGRELSEIGNGNDEGR